MLHGRVLPCLAVFASTMFGSDPAEVHTRVLRGRAISFWVENKYRAPVTRFQVVATSSMRNLECSITAEVKQPKDLHPPGTCSFTTNGADVIDKKWKARLVYIEFADGMRWTSER